ncbi:MAG: hypothetical protein EPN97_01095 [Alphaproteobacteria bacterium]|nr:MAG: hypothetical protein EPN97_01095 [Alphaproteobacteria bacterium]
MDGSRISKHGKKVRLFTPFGLLLLALSLGYIGAEALFNMRLVDIAGSVKSNPDEIRDLQHFGRAVSGYGFSLLALGAFAGAGFKMKGRREWAMFFTLTAFGFVPFVFKFQDTIFGIFKGVSDSLHEEQWDTQMSMLPFMGLALVLLSAGKFRAHVILGLVLIAWPAMFLGQKLVIERYLVDRTDWQERQNARYMLMIRGGLEDCQLKLRELQFCDASRGEANMKAARIVISTLWMLSPDEVLQDLEASKDDIVKKAAAAGTWFSSKELYAKYVKKISDERGKYLQDISKRYYKPYMQASALFQKAADPAAAQAEADKAVAEVENGINAGWEKYQKAVHDYRQQASVIANVALQQALAIGRPVAAICRNRNCPQIDARKAIAEAQERGEREFFTRSGYHSDIPDRATFLAQPPTQEKLKKSVEAIVQSRYGMDGFTLPADWKYDPASFGKSVKDTVLDRAHDAWKAKFGDKLPPGLDEERFFATIGVGKIPTIEEMVMSQDEFYKKVVLPGNTKIVDEMVADLNKDRDKFPADATEMEEGKDYVSALYVPAISLVISLSVVVLTILRGFMALMDIVLKSGGKQTGKRWHYAGQCSVAIFFASMLLTLPHIYPNPYASGPAYDRYYAAARQKHPIAAAILNWSVQVQPVIYKLGKDIRRITG